MFSTTKWDILIVDDEADVLALSRLVLQDMEVYGLPLVLHTAQSKAEVIDLLNNESTVTNDFAVAFVDVVMETDDAGLTLCDYIREEFGSRLTQLFIRTGQPGLSPERAVIDQYEINGYFTKIEATEDKLYSLIKSGVRQFLWLQVAQMYTGGFSEILRSANWRQQIERLLRGFVEADPQAADVPPFYIAFDNQVIIQQGAEQQQVAQWQQLLDGTTGLRLSLDGNTYARTQENLWGIHIVPTNTNVDVRLICQTAFDPPDDLVAMTHDFLQGLAALWQHG